MNLTDDLLRSALRETGGEIPSDRVPALDLATRRNESATSRRVSRPRTRWLTAAAAAVAVVAVIAVSAVLAGRDFGRPGSSDGPAAGIGPLPRYFADLETGRGCRPNCLVIHDARTGAVLATATASSRQPYGPISTAANDTTFVVATANLTAGGWGGGFLLARFDSVRHTITFRKLPIPPLSDVVYGFAVSPDGRELAVAVNDPVRQLRLYSVATGAVKVWTTTGIVDSEYGQEGLSWANDSLLAFDWGRPHDDRAEAGQQGIRLLDTSAPPGDLLAASRLAVSQDQASGYVLQGRFAMTNNGTAIASAVERWQGAVNSQYEVFSARTGRVIRTFLPSTQRGESLWWANSAGTLFVGSVPASGPDPTPLEWISGSAHTPVRGLQGGPLFVAF